MVPINEVIAWLEAQQRSGALYAATDPDGLSIAVVRQCDIGQGENDLPMLEIGGVRIDDNEFITEG